MLFSRHIALLAGLAITAVKAIPTISAKGSKFFTSDGNQFFVKGIAYQLTSDDPLADPEQCKLDVALMRTLGTNAIRVYHVDPTADHTSCMATFADAGIYLFLDLDTFTSWIDQANPAWTSDQATAFARVMDAFQGFDNTAGFFVGNEVLNTNSGSPAAPYVKAAVRDMKAYRDAKGYRDIPVGYSAADIASLRPMLQNYLACGSVPGEAIDFFALNAYEWCGNVDYQTSGYEQLTDMIVNYNVPIFFSETGCIVPPGRTFADQSAILGPDMNQYWSGAIIYEWIQESNAYGLISYGPHVDPASPGAPPDGFPRTGTPTPIQPDFSNLSGQWKTLNPTGIKESDYTPTNTPPPCPASTPGIWLVNGNVPLPAVAAIGSGNGGTAAAPQQAGVQAAATNTAAAAAAITTSSGVPSSTTMTSSRSSTTSAATTSATQASSASSSSSFFTSTTSSFLGSTSSMMAFSTTAVATAAAGGISSTNRKMGFGMIGILLGLLWWM